MESSRASVNYEKMNAYIAAGAAVMSIIAAIVYVAVAIAEMNLKIAYAERLKTLEVKIEKLEEK